MSDAGDLAVRKWWPNPGEVSIFKSHAESSRREVFSMQCRPTRAVRGRHLSRGLRDNPAVRGGSFAWRLIMEERFWAKVDLSDPEGCWPWMGSTSEKGYGRMHLRGKNTNAHRVSWELHFGPIPLARFICHSCDNPPCVNPAHLWLGDNTANMRDMVQKGRHRYLRGEEHGRATLTNADILEIRRIGRSETQKEIAMRYGVSRSIISQILLRRVWKHI